MSKKYFNQITCGVGALYLLDAPYVTSYQEDKFLRLNSEIEPPSRFMLKNLLMLEREQDQAFWTYFGPNMTHLVLDSCKIENVQIYRDILFVHAANLRSLRLESVSLITDHIHRDDFHSFMPNKDFLNLARNSNLQKLCI